MIIRAEGEQLSVSPNIEISPGLFGLISVKSRKPKKNSEYIKNMFHQHFSFAVPLFTTHPDVLPSMNRGQDEKQHRGGHICCCLRSVFSLNFLHNRPMTPLNVQLCMDLGYYRYDISRMFVMSWVCFLKNWMKGSVCLPSSLKWALSGLFSVLSCLLHD